MLINSYSISALVSGVLFVMAGVRAGVNRGFRAHGLHADGGRGG